MALTILSPRYPNYPGNTQDDLHDIPGRTDIANAWDYNTHDAEIIAHQSVLFTHGSWLDILNSRVNQAVLNTSTPTFAGAVFTSTLPVVPSGYPLLDNQVANKAYVDAQIPGGNFWESDSVNVYTDLTGASVIPNASGTQSIGSLTYPWGAGYFNTLYGDGSHLTGVVIYTIYFLFSDPGGWDNLTLPIASVKKDNVMTIVQVDCTAIGTGSPSLTFNIEERVWGSFNLAGTNITSSPMVAGETGIEVASFSNPEIDAHAALFLTTGVSSAVGTVDYIVGTVYYTI